MASIQFGDTSGSKPYCVLTVNQGSQNVSANTTDVSFSLVLKRPSRVGSSAEKSWSVTINGTSRSGSGTIGGSGDLTLLTGTVSVPHNSDGTKTISFYGSCTIDITWSGNWLGTINGTGSMTLSSIARSSSFGTIIGNTIGSAMTININRSSSSFTHQLWYSIGSSGYVSIGSGIATYKTWTPPISLCSHVPNNNALMTFRLRTYNGSTQVGSDIYINQIVNVPTSVKPSISSVVVSEANDVVKQMGGYVQSQSYLNVGVNAAGVYGSTITNYDTVIQGRHYGGRNFESGAITASGTVTITSTVTDSRGQKASKSVSITVMPYAIPGVTSIKAERCNSAGTLTDSGTSVKCTFSYAISALNNNNSVTISLSWLNGSTWTDLKDWYSPYSGTLSYVAPGPYSVDYTYRFRVMVQDSFRANVSETIVNPSFTLMNFNASGRGIGMGKVSSKNAIELGLPIFDNRGQEIKTGCLTSDGDNLNTTLQHQTLSPTNAPDGSWSFVTTFFNKSNMAIRTQYAVKQGSNRLYIRGTSSAPNDWSSWVLCSNQTEINNTVNPVKAKTDKLTLKGWVVSESNIRMHTENITVNPGGYSWIDLYDSNLWRYAAMSVMSGDRTMNGDLIVKGVYRYPQNGYNHYTVLFDRNRSGNTMLSIIRMVRY